MVTLFKVELKRLIIETVYILERELLPARLRNLSGTDIVLS